MIQPVIIRELTAAVRRPAFTRDRGRIALIGFLVFGVVVLAAQLETGSPMGATIFRPLAWILWVACVSMGSAMTADTLSRERREGTLGLLFLTPLTAWDVVLGKLASGAGTALYRLLTLTPMLTCTLLLGGIMGIEVLAAVIICLNTLFLALAFGMLISSSQTDDRTAFSLTFVGFMGLSLLPYALEACLPPLLVPGFGAESPYLFLSPAYAINILAAPVWMGGLKILPMILALLLQHAMGWALLLATAARLRSIALDRPPQLLGAWGQRLQHWWHFGSPWARAQHRRRWLAVHPILWLGLRYRRKQTYVWMMFGLLAAVGTGMALFLDDRQEVPAFLIGYVFLSLGFLKIWLTSETCTRVLEDRRSGALELILTTPTSVRAWIHGQAGALKQLFFRPLAASGSMVAILIIWHLTDNSSERPYQQWGLLLAVVAVTLMDLPAFFWMSLWEALPAASVNAAATRVLRRVLFPAYGIALLSYLIFLWLQANSAGRLDSPSAPVLWFGWVVLNGVIDGQAYLFARSRVLRRFQEIVAEGNSGAADPGPVHPVLSAQPPQHPLAHRIRSVLVRRPVVTALAIVGAAISAYIGIRNRLWDGRVAQARAQLAEVSSRMSTRNPVSRSPSSASASSIRELLANARGRALKPLELGPVGNPYSATNQARVTTLIQPFLPLADQLLQLPDDFQLPWVSVASDPWGNQQLPNHVLCSAILVLSIRLHWATESGQNGAALQIFQAMGRMTRALNECPTPILNLAANEVAEQLIDSLKRWLNSNGPTQPELDVISHRLADLDSWLPANQRLHRLPAFLAHDYDHPFFFNRGTELALLQTLDLLTAARRKEGVRAFQQSREALDAILLPEPQRLRQLLGLVNHRVEDPFARSLFAPGWTSMAFRSYLSDADVIRQIRLARAAVSVELFWQRQGRLPRNQQEMIAQEGPAWPLDPWTAEPLVYERCGGGYRITLATPPQKLSFPRMHFIPGRWEASSTFEVQAVRK